MFLAFAINNLESLEGVKIWLKEVKDYGHEEIVFFLVGTKSDLED